MKKFLSIINLSVVAFASVIIFTGCTSINVDKDKSIEVEGFATMNVITTGYDPATQTYTPSLKSIFAYGKFLSLPMSKEVKDYICYSYKSSSSMFNASAKTETCTLIFATTNKELMSKAIDIIKEQIIKTSFAAPDSGQN